MGQISLLHIGDIHFSIDEMYKNSINPRNFYPNQWNQLSDDEKSDFIQFLIIRIKKSIFNLIEEEKFDSIIFTGDLCHRGILSDYEACLNYLKMQFQNFRKKIKQNSIEISAGNHDLISDLDYDPDNLSERFLPFCDKLITNGYHDYAIEDINISIIDREVGKILLLNVNSCLDFKNLELLQPSQRETILAIIEREGLHADKNRLLNIPYIQNRLIDDICRIIQNNPDCLPIIITHHNFFRIRNFDPNREYDGIVNEGVIRPRLEALHRPMIILHGHIHYCHKEEIGPSGAKIIFSSAPLLFPSVKKIDDEMYGYKLVRIIFANDEVRTPIGCEIISHILDGDKLVPQTPIKVAFYDSGNSIESLDANEKVVLKTINHLASDIYLGDLYQKIITKRIVTPDFNFQSFLQVINNLSWRNLIIYTENKTNQVRGTVRGKVV